MIKETIIVAKKESEKLLSAIQTIEKSVGKTDASIYAKKCLTDFIKCNISSPSIIQRYDGVRKLLQNYKELNND